MAPDRPARATGGSRAARREASVTLSEDAHGNSSNSPTTRLGSRGVITVSDDPNHTIATIGCSGLIIVRTKDTMLVCPISEAERVKDLAGMVDKKLR